MSPILSILMSAILAFGGMNLGLYMENECKPTSTMGKLCVDNGRNVRIFSITALIVIAVVGSFRVIMMSARQ